MNLQEQISRILKEDSNIPFVILRRVTPENIEEAFEFALDRMGYMMENPNSFIYKKKETTLRVFAKSVIDEMVTYLEQDYFTDDNRVYFEDDDFYYDKIRKPLLKHYGNRIKERYYEII
jgi:phosphomevalonate kinase